jgi:hypothetical protein
MPLLCSEADRARFSCLPQFYSILLNPICAQRFCTMEVTQVIKQSILGLIDIFVDPESAVRCFDRKTAWALPFCIVGTGNILLGLASLPILVRVVGNSFPVGTPEDQVHEIIDSIVKYQYIAIFLGPVGLLARWLFWALVLYMSCMLFDMDVTFDKLFSLIAQCSLITLLQDLVVFIIVKAQGDEIQTIADLSPKLGLDLLITTNNKAIMTIVKYFSAFNIWYIVVLVLGLSYLSGSSRMKALAATIPIWFLQIGLLVELALFS